MGRPRVVRYEAPQICQRKRKVTGFLDPDPDQLSDIFLVCEWPYRVESYSVNALPPHGLPMRGYFRKLNVDVFSNRDFIECMSTYRGGLWVGPAGIKTVLNNVHERLSISLKR